MKRALGVAALIVASCVIGALAWSALRSSHPEHVEQPAAAAPLGTHTLVNLSDLKVRMSYQQAVSAAAVGDLIVATQRAELDAFLASLYTPPAPSAPRTAAPSYQRGNAVGDCSGFAIPDYIIQRESGGDPNAVNPSSGAYGCAQTLPGHYAAVSPWNSSRPGECFGLDMYSIDGQRACVDKLSNGGTNLDPWAETR